MPGHKGNHPALWTMPPPDNALGHTHTYTHSYLLGKDLVLPEVSEDILIRHVHLPWVVPGD